MIIANCPSLSDVLWQTLVHLLFNFSGPCDRCDQGHFILMQDKSKADRQFWRCSNRHRFAKISICKHSFFSQSHLSISTILKLVYCWMHNYAQYIALHETALSKKTVIDFYNFCREVCSVMLDKQSQPIGGPGKIVEIDESMFGKRNTIQDNGSNESRCLGGLNETAIHHSVSLCPLKITLPLH